MGAELVKGGVRRAEHWLLHEECARERFCALLLTIAGPNLGISAAVHGAVVADPGTEARQAHDDFGGSRTQGMQAVCWWPH